MARKNGVYGSSQDVRQDMARRHSFSLVPLKKKSCLKKLGCSGLPRGEGEVLNKNSNDKHMQSSL